MGTLVADCPRCRSAKITFDVRGALEVPCAGADWQRAFEAFSICRNCISSTVFLLRLSKYDARQLINSQNYWTGDANINAAFDIRGYISLKDSLAVVPPDHLPDDLKRVFQEGATCLAVNCFNAASTMFRLCLDLATRDLLPAESDNAENQPNRKQRRDLGLRIPWLIEQGRLPANLAALAGVVKEDGNDGAHAGNLSKADAEDLLDFTAVLLERLYTEPARIALAEARRAERRTR
jgi:hypothetical protein